MVRRGTAFALVVTLGSVAWLVALYPDWSRYPYLVAFLGVGVVLGLRALFFHPRDRSNEPLMSLVDDPEAFNQRLRDIATVAGQDRQPIIAGDPYINFCRERREAVRRVIDQIEAGACGTWEYRGGRRVETTAETLRDAKRELEHLERVLAGQSA